MCDVAGVRGVLLRVVLTVCAAVQCCMQPGYLGVEAWAGRALWLCPCLISLLDSLHKHGHVWSCRGKLVTPMGMPA
jgi:hypothetical protein